MKISKILTLLVLVSFANFSAAMELQQSNGNWYSGVLFRDDGTKVYRAISNVHQKFGIDTLFAVDLENDCSTINPNILVNVQKGADRSGFLNLGAFQARVDTTEIIEGSWTSNVNNMGDSVIFISLIAEASNQLIKNIKLGNTLRIKISFFEEDQSDIYFKFSLRGSSAAIGRASALCKVQMNNDQRYFEKNMPENKNEAPADSGYFL